MKNDRIFSHLKGVMAISTWAFLLLQTSLSQVNAQCIPVSGQVSGSVFNDVNLNGTYDAGEPGIPGIRIAATAANGAWLGNTLTDASGNFQFTGLSDGNKIRLIFSSNEAFQISLPGIDNRSDVQNVTVPSCKATLGLVSSSAHCNSSTEIITTCFVQGNTDVRTIEPTIVGISYGFNSASPARKFAMHGETGSIWGLAWKSSTQEIFSAAFVKQHSGLKYGHDAIMKTSFNGSMYTTSLFARLSDLGIQTEELTVKDPNDCNYGKQVGKTGLGALVISPDEKNLYTVNINTNSIVKVPTTQPIPATTKSFAIPVEGGHAFALKYYNDKLYVGSTIPGKHGLVHVFDPSTGTFSDTGLRIPVGADWSDNPVVGGAPAHWLTDIDFTDNGDMLISLSDRIGHMYCNSLTSRLDEQKGDLLIAWDNGNGWTLENRNDGQEFFSDDFWITQPNYHSEITIGSIFAMPGTRSVVAAVFDPETNSYSGGLHRYSTETGKKTGSKELYTRDTEVLFGKATGFGDIVATCGLPKITFGNLVWHDRNGDGLQNADEEGLAGVRLSLLDETCKVVATTLSSPSGHYNFSSDNLNFPVLPGNKYYIALDPLQKDEETALYQFGDLYYSLTASNQDAPSVNSDIVSTDAPCAQEVIEIKSVQSTHTYDLGFVLATGCDLKIVQRVLNNQPVKVGDLVRFEVEVQNNSENTIQGVDISNILQQGYTFDSGLNPGWKKQDNRLTFNLSQRLKPGEFSRLPLTLGFDASSKNFAFTNEAVLEGVYDADGNLFSDLSDCFSNLQNGAARATPQVCDLALTHRTVKGQIFSPGNPVTLITSVCNQGTMPADAFDIVVYLQDGMDFNPALNPGWTLSDDLSRVFYAESKLLGAEQCRDYSLNLHIQKDYSAISMVSFAEIADSRCDQTVYDFDSTPDDNPQNDRGGVPGSPSDNTTTSSDAGDEDDHDPAIIPIELYDLALEKTVQYRRAYSGQKSIYTLKVTNEGAAAVSAFRISEHIPDGLTLEDQDWVMDGKVATRWVHVDGGLQPGDYYSVQCTLAVSKELKGPAIIHNVAEITSILDMQGRDVSELDIDSKPGNYSGLEIAGLPGANDEDDVSSAYVVLISPLTYTPCTTCRAATNASNGQFETTIKLGSMSGESWFVESSLGLYDFGSSLPPASPVLLTEGSALTEVPAGVSSYYEIKALHLDGKGFSIRVRNNFGDLEELEVAPGTCTFTHLNIDGPVSLCNEISATFTAQGNPGGPLVWSVNGMPVSGVSGPEFTVEGNDWEDFGASPYNIRVGSPNTCVAPGEHILKTGIADFNAVACKGSIQVSLDGDCSVEVTPAMLVAGNIHAGSPYVVMLMDKYGNIIPDATLTHEHEGTTLTGKLLEGCGGNSCWSNITVEDKIAPVSLCRDIVLPCFKLEEFKGPFESDNCEGLVSNILVHETRTPLYCDKDYVMFIDRVYRATDKAGNMSAPCEMRISLERPNLDIPDLKFPANFLMTDNSALLCNSFKTDEYGRPSPSVTGMPTLAGIPLYPTFSDVCNVVSWYTDEDLGYIGCTRKIKRTWHVYEQWCSAGRFISVDQSLEIIDNTKPTITPIPAVSVSTSPHLHCMAEVTLPLPQVGDACNPQLTINVAWPGGFISDMKSPALVQLPAGIHNIVYTVYDGCLNSSQTTFIVNVADKTAPLASCKGEISVSLNSQGEAYITPPHINNGSFDGCSPVRLFVAEMAPGAVLTEASFGNDVAFDCSDAGLSRMVALMVKDEDNNTNFCMMQVHVQDKILPQITCPPHLTIDCSEVFTGMDLTIYGNATAFDVCGATVRELSPVFQVDNCRVGTITRRFTAADNLGTTPPCEQRIQVVSNDAFDPVSDVDQPEDYTAINICSVDDLGPEDLPAPYGYPVIRQSACGMASSTHSDEVYTFATDACYKILRKWTVIDWCEMNRLGDNYVPYRFTQVIKVLNTNAPVFTGVFAVRDTFLTYPGSCTTGPVQIQVTAQDDCTLPGQLAWIYKVDLDQNGIIDMQQNGTGSIATLQQDLPLGTHTVQWSFEDSCGNIVTRDQIIVVRNDKKPVAVSVESISVSVVPWDRDGDGIADIEKACIQAHTLDASSVSFCCSEPLRFSFSADINDVERCFNCTNVGKMNVVELWVHDCFGNTDVALVNIDVQDNNDSDICENFCLINAPQPAITGNLSVCSGASTTLTATGGTAYQWSTGATTPSVTVSPLSNTIYRVTVTNDLGCSATTLATVSVRANPVAGITGPNVCPGASTTLTASGGVSYVWSNGATTASITVSPAVATTYSVTVTNATGCTASASRLVTILPRPVVNISGINTICIGTSTTLTASAPTGSTFAWSHGPTSASVVVSPSASTSYTVTITDTNGCTNSASRNVTVNSRPVAAISGDLSICTGDNTVLTASGGASYVWSTGTTGAVINVSPTTNTTYTVTVTGNNGCTSTASATVLVDNGELVCATQPATIYLNASGSVTLLPSQISTGVSGECADISLSVSPNVFNCNDVFVMHTVVLTVTNNNNGNSLTCTAVVTVRDTLKPNIVCPSNLTIPCDEFSPLVPLINYGSATATDNCPSNLVVTSLPIINLNQCNVGQIIRTFTATDNSNNTKQCVQSINVVNNNPVTLANINFPPDITLTNCASFDPSATGNTTVNTNLADCSDISISFSDNKMLVPPVCVDTLIRTWTVRDSCQLVPGTNNGIFTHVQTIYIGTQVPVITGPSNITLHVDPSTCMGFLESGTHNAIGCDLTLNNDRTNDGTLNIKGDYPLGNTTVRLTASQSCNNTADTLDVLITVVDTFDITFLCVKTFPEIKDVSPAPMAMDFVSTHYSILGNCLEGLVFRASFNRNNVNDTMRNYDCSQVGDEIPIKIYFWLGNSVIDSCTELVTPVDPNQICPTNRLLLSGQVKTESHRSVPEVAIYLDGSDMPSQMTSGEGTYIFPRMDGGGSYRVRPVKNSSPLEGVSTLDLIQIQRHILKAAPLQSPYKIIAADINADKKVTAADIVQLRKLLLGVYQNFPENNSWRMVDKAYAFFDKQNPLSESFPEAYTIDKFNKDMAIDWVGIKTGDVNDSYNGNVQNTAVQQRNATVLFQMENKILAEGEVLVPVYASGNAEISGFQTSLQFEDVLEASLSAGTLNVNMSNFSFVDGKMHISWHDTGANRINSGDILFYLHLKVNKRKALVDIISQASSWLSSEYYTADFNPLALSWRMTESSETSFAVSGNYPNPWKNHTALKVHMPVAGDVMVRVRDVAGKVIHAQRVLCQKGDNLITLTDTEIPIAGILFCDVMAGNEVRTIKMIHLK